MTCAWTDCRNAEVVASLPFVQESEGEERWGVLVCRPSTLPSKDTPNTPFAGLVGPMLPHTVGGPCYGITLLEQDTESAAAVMMLTCALSILETGAVEGGDAVIVNDTGLLASALLTVGFMQGAICLQTSVPAREDPLGVGRQAIDLHNPAWREKLADTDYMFRGQTVFFKINNDTKDMNIILSNLGKMGRLVLCRQNRSLPALFNAYRDLHRTSSEVRSWSLMPGTRSYSGMTNNYGRVQRLIRWRKNLLDSWLANVVRHDQE